MFEADTPKHKVGFLSPLAIIDNAAYEFYRLAPPGVMAVMIPIGLSEFSVHDVDRVFEPIDKMLDQLLERGIEMTIQAGTPLAVIMGVAAHDKLIAHIEKKTGKPATSTIQAVTRAAKAMKVKKIAFANKWSAQMNKTMGEFFAREGIESGSAATRDLTPADFVKIPAGDHMRLCYELSKKALNDNPDCDALYIGGGTWLSEPVVRAIEKETDKTIICNQTAQMWDLLNILKEWKPRQGSSRLMTLP